MGRAVSIVGRVCAADQDAYRGRSWLPARRADWMRTKQAAGDRMSA